MENLDVETGFLSIGPTAFHVNSLGSHTRETFKKKFKGRLGFDMDLAWDLIERARAILSKQPPKEEEKVPAYPVDDHGSIGKPVKEDKKPSNKPARKRNTKG